MASRADRIIQLRDDALNAADPHHQRIRREQAIYHTALGNTGGMYQEYQELIGNFQPQVAESLDPQVTSAINRLIPVFAQQAPPIDVMPSDYTTSQLEVQLTGDIERWMKTLNMVDSESDQLISLIYHNLVSGNAICKTWWDRKHHCYRSRAIDPKTFAPDPTCSAVDLACANYVVHRNNKRGELINWKYGLEGYTGQQIYCIDEMWMTKDVADYCSINVSECRTPLVRVLLIDDKIVKATPNPFWFPGYPFTCWRNFHLMKEGAAQDFWGFGLATLLWPQQKLLDDIWASIIYIARRTATGRLVTNPNTLDTNKDYHQSGLVIEVEDGADIDDIKELPTEQVPTALFNVVALMTEAMNRQVPSNSPTFVGQAPYEGASGRAINQLQSAAFLQLEDWIVSVKSFLLRRAGRKIALIQQLARRPSAPHQWREGVDLPHLLTHDHRRVRCFPKIKDDSVFPNTPAGKWEMLQLLMSQGYVINPEKLIQLFGINDIFSPEDLVPPQPPIRGESTNGGQGQTA